MGRALVGIVLLMALSCGRIAWATTVTAGMSDSGTPVGEPGLRRVMLPSNSPSGNPINDRIPVIFVPATTNTTGSPAPAVVLLHALGEPNDAMMRRMARFFAARGMHSAIMQLPYHMLRLPPHVNPLTQFVGRDAERAVQAFQQSASDVGVVVTWLREQPGVDPERIGVVGVSLGAIVGHLAMGLDERLSAGVCILGGGRLASIYRRSLLPRVLYPFLPPRLSKSQEETVARVDPITYADRNRPRRVLMIQAARDVLVPPSDAEALRRALGNPPAIWVDSNHYAPIFAETAILRASADYLWSVWRPSPSAEPMRLPTIIPPLIKAGFVFGLDSLTTPAVSVQVLRAGMRKDHMGLLHADAGWSGRGPFVAVGLTVNAHVDAGYAWRLGARRVRPFVALHLAL